MSRSSMSIFFSWLSVMLCTNIALNTGDLKRTIIFSASNLVLLCFVIVCHVLPGTEDDFVTGQLDPLTSDGHVTEGSRLQQEIEIRWKFLGTNLATGLGFHLNTKTEWNVQLTVSWPLLNSPPWPPGRTAAHPSRRWWSRTRPSACPRGWSGCSEGRAAANWANKL